MIFKRENPQTNPQEEPDTAVQDFLNNEGKEIVIIHSRADFRENAVYKLYGSRAEKKEQLKEIAVIKNWLKMPYIFDSCKQECERWEFVRKATKKYGKEVQLFMKKNRINSEVLEQLVESIEVLIRIFASYNQDNRAIHAGAAELVYSSSKIYGEFKNIISIPPETKNHVRQRLLELNFPISKKMKERSASQDRKAIIHVISQLENVCIKVLEKFETKG